MSMKTHVMIPEFLVVLLIAVSTPVSISAQINGTFVPTQTLVQTSLPIITLENYMSPVTFTAIVASTSTAQPLGPSSGTVTYTVSGEDAFKWVKAKPLGTGLVSRLSVSGVATLALKRASEGLILLPGTYNVTAKFSGSSDGLFSPSEGSTTFRIAITSPPVVWGL
ncbi:hypothetical protein COCSUDRAFT_52792 [Coccomyxa subellipsoidea C-169]|uniref:Uncharacterized protein n=1 Tax=Coccomyxa subellipsoidea (strain C-169) TaxID=574566 RepID=I0Z3I6_COCSC|nr:hypothetical protein COCSUDRAFT_52792 [Coccomyxa subellipsoidea C-169]EIE25205.1 hypothetical protein COCSUDRAFT_52792 [Coccomyxa subellipsoidea C-169]|eukprot:XP_005649749.1 hypothetical protein COCSUDRAFT_52792 [Coccomyxa subellipsoidea C-169]